ncbi:XdhC family protein [Methylomonas sp. EFPC1]|uniref:XdhC family protein n=1 Tax=Methylomonas sp. EFPC1 TaxID=2812647 RepID=UPI0019681F57|nr:XdhC/CoxI family protein [Methylomonas sp. EFPC1]QSA99510.1 XdhC family protein [Methylomonas sp. EFPC1]
MAHNINHLLEAYRQLQRDRQDSVLATIIETFGSTYQKAGARMLITQAGELVGLLGGGCFERDLVEQAAAVFATGAAKTVFYDMRSGEDAIWGLGLGCNGAVRVLLQLLKAEQDFSPLSQLVEAAEAQAHGVLVTVFESAHADFPSGRSQFLPAAIVGEQPILPSAPFPFATAALQTALQQKPRIETHPLDGQDIKVFYDPVQPPWQLLIFGVGADAIPLVNYAKSLGWRVTLVDHRPAHIKPERFPLADQLLHLMPDQVASQLDLNRFNAIMLMTHNVEYDQRYLQAIVHCRVPFIGLLGPAHRKQRLLQSLGDNAALIAERVFGPVGLDIGAQTPEEIALSIVAGIQAQLNGRSGLQLGKEPVAVKQLAALDNLHAGD